MKTGSILFVKVRGLQTYTSICTVHKHTHNEYYPLNTTLLLRLFRRYAESLHGVYMVCLFKLLCASNSYIPMLWTDKQSLNAALV